MVAAGALLVACTGGGPSTSGSSGSSGDGSGTLTYLMGQPEEAEQLNLIKADIAEFEKANPGVKVKLNTMPTENLRTVLQTQLRSGEGPDVFSYDTGPGFAGVLAEAGLLYDLTDAYAENDWPIYDWAKERVTFDSKILGVPNGVEEIGIFYNKDLFAEHGIAEPGSLPELEAAAEKLAAAGITPFAFSNKEGWQGGHILSVMLASSVGADGMEALLAGDKSWSDPEIAEAIDRWFADYLERGFLPRSPNAITGDNGNSLFYAGKAAMHVTGSWLTLDLENSVDYEVGFIPFPAKDGPGIFAGGLGGGTFVSANTKNAEAAVAFLDYLQSPEHGRWSVEKMNTIPAFAVDNDGIEASPLFEQILADTDSIAAGTGQFGYNIDVMTTDEFNQAMWQGLQSVLNGTKDGQEVANELDEAFRSSAEG
jgi:raffinose/stachyose/melibiose transport system substrate-binding protein